MKRSLSCTASQINSAAIWRQPTRRACFACRDSPTGNFPRNSSSKRAKKAMRSTRSAISRLTKTRPKRPGILATTKNARRNVPSDHKSQSEHDWAYAKRALARGDDPEVVIQRIADYRAEDKNDPIYYARHTVAKAKEQLKKNDHHVQPEIAERIDLNH